MINQYNRSRGEHYFSLTESAPASALDDEFNGIVKAHNDAIATLAKTDGAYVLFDVMQIRAEGVTTQGSFDVGVINAPGTDWALSCYLKMTTNAVRRDANSFAFISQPGEKTVATFTVKDFYWGTVTKFVRIDRKVNLEAALKRKTMTFSHNMALYGEGGANFDGVLYIYSKVSF